MEHESAEHRAHRMLRDGGYKGGGEVKVAKRVVRKALREHENAEHGGKHEKLKLKAGGAVHGEQSEHRPDRRARGGETMAKPAGRKGAPTINIHVGGGGAGAAKGLALGARLGAAKAMQAMGGGQGAPMPAAAPPGAPMPGMDAGAPMPGQKRGGEVVRKRGGKC